MSPEKILLVTFTNRAAQEFRSRLVSLSGTKANRVWMNTIHAAGARILREHGRVVGIDPDFVVYDEADSLKIIRSLLKTDGVGAAVTPATVLRIIQRWKEQLLTPTTIDPKQQTPEAIHAQQVFSRYERALRKFKAVDFSDLIQKPVQLLRRQEGLAAQLDLEHVIVDEFQDTDRGQLELLRLLSNPSGNFCAVGDIDQSVYSFRGAEPTLMLKFQEFFPLGKTMHLGQNYRCSPQIVGKAAGLISRNNIRIPHRIWSENRSGREVRVLHQANHMEEAEWITAEVFRLERLGVPLEEIAVLYRTNHQSQALERQLVRAGIPHQLHGHRFFDRPEVKDTIAYLKWLAQPEDMVSLARAVLRPSRGITDATWEKLTEKAEIEGTTVLDQCQDTTLPRLRRTTKEALANFYRQMTGLQQLAEHTRLPGLLLGVWHTTGLRKWYEEGTTGKDRKVGAAPKENLDELQRLITAEFPGKSLEELPRLLEYSALMSQPEDQPNKGVQLLTIHAAKGTEYRAVIVVGCEEGLLPHYLALQDPNPAASIEEERRLLYVAMTRAKEQLTLTWARERRSASGAVTQSQPSRFLKELQ